MDETAPSDSNIAKVTDAQLSTPEGALVVPKQPVANRAGVWFSLVVPTYNEHDNMQPLVQQVAEHLDPRYAGRYEIIVVDDNSVDGTADIVLSLAAKHPHLRLVKRTNERGLATAVIRGWQQSAGEVLGVMDGDLQHPTSVLVSLLEQIENGADMAVASRYVEQGSVGEWGALRRIVSKGAGSIGSLLVPEAICKVSDPMSGYFVLRRAVVADELLKPRGYKILLEVLARGDTGRIVEVPFEFALRQHGVTKLTWRQYVEYIQQLMDLRMHIWSKGSKHK